MPPWSRSGCWRVRSTLDSLAYKPSSSRGNLLMTWMASSRWPRLPKADRGKSRPRRLHRIRADAVTFSYPGRNQLALQAANIEINRGEVVALVGENGSGKTTLAKVMAGLYEPGSGAVRWDGIDVRTFRPDLFRERVAIIFQDFVKYALSAEENIAVARPDDDIDHAAVREAARLADADSFLSALPAGYQTPLSRRFVGGHELSGGQWQKVAIARAFYRSAPLVIIDEPTAALDARAEYELFSSLHEILRGRSALIISHGSPQFGLPTGSTYLIMVGWWSTAPTMSWWPSAASMPSCFICRLRRTRSTALWTRCG